MKTEKLYLNDMNSAYNINFDAKVVSIEENKIVLDRTLFYPLGGGQNCWNKEQEQSWTRSRFKINSSSKTA